MCKSSFIITCNEQMLLFCGVLPTYIYVQWYSNALNAYQFLINGIITNLCICLNDFYMFLGRFWGCLAVRKTNLTEVLELFVSLSVGGVSSNWIYTACYTESGRIQITPTPLTYPITCILNLNETMMRASCHDYSF